MCASCLLWPWFLQWHLKTSSFCERLEISMPERNVTESQGIRSLAFSLLPNSQISGMMAGAAEVPEGVLY